MCSGIKAWHPSGHSMVLQGFEISRLQGLEGVLRFYTVLKTLRLFGGRGQWSSGQWKKTKNSLFRNAYFVIDPSLGCVHLMIW